MLSGCNQNEQKQTDKIEIKAAPTLTNDATTYAHKAWDLINQIDPIVYTKKWIKLMSKSENHYAN